MAEVLDSNKNISTNPPEDRTAQTKEAEAEHRHMEHEAMNAAKRAGERMKKNEAGNDIISNM